MRGLVFSLLFLCLVPFVFADDPALVAGKITVFGSKIEVSPAILETPAGVPIFINTTGKGLAGKLVGELRGPSITQALTFETAPGSPFQLPALTTKGNYFFEDIRLVNNGQILASATPNRVEIRVIEILITQISSRPLSLEEIQSLGIVINENDFSAASFEVGLQFNSQQIKISFPLLLPKKPNLQPLIPPSLTSVAFAGPQLPAGIQINELPPLPHFVPVNFKPETSDPEFELNLPDIPGIIVFPNEIAFLNQFFAVVLMVRNGASAGTNLTVDDLTAQIVVDPDDLKLVKTNPSVPLGSPVPIRVQGADGLIGTSDDVELILAQQTAEAEFFVEGLTEGTHTVRMNLNAVLRGLVQGDVPISGSATGAVLVRNPNFSITFSHPAIVRAFEEYDLFITVTNTSDVYANLVRLSIPSNALVNTIIRGDSYQDFEVIKPGESATAKFRMEPQITGQVAAAVLTSSGSVKGQFQFRIGVGEKGIPLSPNTLVLPDYAHVLGSDLVQKALNLLGLAYSAATAPPGGLPPGVPYLSKAVVYQRAVEMAQAGQRFQLGESRTDTLSHVLLDWLGNDSPDTNFDILRRTTEKGRELFDEIFSQMNVGGSNAIAFHQNFANATFFRKPYISAVLQSSGNPVTVSISDAAGNMVFSSGGEFGPLNNLANADLLRSPDGQVQWAVIGTVTEPLSYTLRIAGAETGSGNLSLIVPLAGSLHRAEFNDVDTSAGRNYTLTLNSTNPDANTYALQMQDESGTILSASLRAISGTSLQAIAAIQDAKADKTGHIVAVLFNQPVSRSTAETRSNYRVATNSTLEARLQNGDRIVYLAFQNPISPFVENNLVISNMTPSFGGSNSTTIPIQTTVTTDAGRVIGRVLSSEGLPVPLARVNLLEIDNDDIFGEATLHVTATTKTNALGEFAFDYVRKLDRSFQVQAQDPLTGDVSSSSSIITQPNQLLRLDVIMLGRGTVQGKVFKQVSGSIVPVSNALVTVIPSVGGAGSVLTDASGNYSFQRIPVGNVNLTAQNQNLADAQKFYGASSTNIPLAGSVVKADIEVTTYQPGKVSGRVLQYNGVDPIIDAYVLLSVNVGAKFPLQLADTTDAQGVFQFEQVPTGTVGLTAFDPATGKSIGSVSVNLQAGGSAVVNIVAKGGSGNIEAFVTPASTMSLSDITVYIEGTSFVQNSMTESSILFEGVSLGTWEVVAIHRITGEKVSARATILYASSTSIVSLRFSEKGTISGVVKTVDGNLAPRSTVLLFLGDGTFANLTKVTTADSTGHYLFTDVPFNTDFTVHAVSENQTDGGRAPAIIRVSQLARNATANVNFVGKGSITVHVETSAGPVFAPVTLSTVTFSTNGRITRNISFTKNTNAATGDAVFTDIFRTPFSVETSTAFTLPARVSGTLTSASTTVNLLLSANPNITGTVHDADGNPVQAVVTYLGKSGTQTLTTDPNGNFTFNHLALGSAVFTASAGTTKGQLSVGISAVNDPIDIHLLGAGSVHGVVKNADGTPAAGASLKLIVPGLLARTLLGSSRSDGTYSFTAVPEGKFSIEAFNGIVGGRASASIIHNQDIPLDLVLDASGTVQGTVFQPDTVTRVPNVEVSLTGPTGGLATSDGNGNFTFRYVGLSRTAESTYTLGALDKNTGRRAESSPFLMTSDGEVVTKNLVLEGKGNVSGFVFDFTGQNAIEGAQLTLKSSGVISQTLVVSTGANGDFQFVGVPQGSFTITATKDLLAGKVQGSITSEGQNAQHNILLEPCVEISGNVVFPDGSPLPTGMNPVIKLSGDGVSRLIDAPDGFFRIGGLPIGSYTLTTNLSYQQKPYRGIVRADISQPGETGLTLRLKGLNTLNVTIDGFTDLTTTVTLTYRNDMEGRSETKIVPTGSTTFLFVPESTFTLTASTGGRLKGSASGQFTGDNETKEIIITLAESGTVQGTVMREAVPVEGAVITLTGGNFTLFAFTDALGQFQIDGVPLGDYTLKAEEVLGGGRARVTGSIDVEQETDIHNLTLDTIAPRVISTLPGAGQASAEVNSTIQVVFSESMDEASTKAAFAVNSTGGQVTGTFTISGEYLSFTPTVPLSPQQTYTIVVGSGAEDVAGNPIDSDFTASFTTVDTVAPTLKSTLPIHLAFNVPLSTTFKFTFSEPIEDRGTYTITRSNGLPAPASTEIWNSNRTSLTLTFAAPFEQNERVAVSISGYRDFAGNVQAAASTVFFDTIDTQAPAAPVLTSNDADNQIREGTSITIFVATSETLVNVDFFIKGALKLHDTTSPYRYDVPSALTTIATNGSDQLIIEATATDRAGNVSAMGQITIKLVPDTAPQISITTDPAPGDIVAGAPIQVSYIASDDGRITKVQIIVTGAMNQTIDMGDDLSSTTQILLPGTVAEGSSIFIKGRATDESGKSTTTPSANFNVIKDRVNPTVSLTAPDPNAVYKTSQTLTARATATDNARVASVEFYISYGSTTQLVGADTVASGSTFEVNFEFPRVDSIQIFARAIDPSGNFTDSAARTLHATFNAFPTLTINEPASGSTVIQKAKITLRATASDSDGTVQKVQLYSIRNGAESLVAEDTSGPTYSANYTVPNSSAPYALTIKAIATDDLGDQTIATSDLTAIPDPKSTVTGRVLDTDSNPVVGATATLLINGLSIATATTNVSGLYEFLNQSTVDGNYIVMATHTLGSGETVAVNPVLPITAMPDIVLRSYATKFYAGLTAQAVTAVHWFDATEGKTDARISYDDAWRFGVLQTAGKLGNARHIHLSGRPVSPFTPEGWVLSIVNVGGQLMARVSHSGNITEMPLIDQQAPVLIGSTNTGLTLQFDAGTAWREGDVYKLASWYLEPVSSTRGGTQEFPAQAVFIATVNELNIYDAVNDSLWMKFTRLPSSDTNCSNNLLAGCGQALKGIDSLYGKIYLALWGQQGGVHVINFRSDSGLRHSWTKAGVYNSTISKRNAKLGFTASGEAPPVGNNTIFLDVDAERVGNDIWILSIEGLLREAKTGSSWSGSGPTYFDWDTDDTAWGAKILFGAGNVLLLSHSAIGTSLGSFFQSFVNLADLIVSSDDVHLGTDQGVYLFRKPSQEFLASFYTAPTKLAGNSNDVRSLTGIDSRLWVATAKTVSGGQTLSGALSLIDTEQETLLQSMSLPLTPPYDLSSIHHGSTSNVPLNLIVGTNNAGAFRIKGDYQLLAGTDALVVLTGPQNPEARLVVPGERIPVFQFLLNNASNSALHIDSITLQASGSGNDALDLAQVSLYQDTDENGEVSPSDPVLASGGYTQDNGILTFTPALDIAKGNTVRLLIAYEWNDLAEAGKTYQLALADAAAIASSKPVSGLDHPITSSVFTLSLLSDPHVAATSTGLLDDEVFKVYYYDSTTEPAGVSRDSNWRNGIVKVVGNPNVNLASGIIVTGTQNSANRLEIQINGDGTFSYRSISSSVTPVPAFTGNVAISSNPVEIPGTGVSLTFNGTEWTTGDVFRIASWYTEPSSGSRSSKRSFPDRGAIVVTRAEISILDADTRALWMRFNRIASDSCSIQRRMYPCSGSQVSAIMMVGGRLFFSAPAFNLSSSGLFVIDFVRDEAFQLKTSLSPSYFGHSSAGMPAANIRERNVGFTYTNPTTSAPLLSKPESGDMSFYWNPVNSTLYTAHVVSEPFSKALDVIKWAPVPQRFTRSIGNPLRTSIAFGPDGALFAAGPIAVARYTNYEQANFPVTSKSITVGTLNDISVSDKGLFVGHSNGVLVFDPATLADKTTYSAPNQLEVSNNVVEMDVASEYLFAGTQSLQDGRLNVIQTLAHQRTAAYSVDQGLPSNQITSISVSRDADNFVALVGTSTSGAALIRGTLDEVVAFNGLTVRKRDLFVTDVTVPQNDVPVLWFDIINDRAGTTTLNSIKLTGIITGNAAGQAARFYRDADLSGSFSDGDVFWASGPFASTMTFTPPPGETIAGKSRAAFILVVDFPDTSTGIIQASFAANSDLSASYGSQPALVTGAPFTGNIINEQ